MTEPARTSRRSWLGLLLFAAPWLLYGVALMLQPDDPFAAWHGDTAWPARHFLAHSQGGLVIPIFGYVMIGGVGAIFVGFVLVAVTRLVCRLLRVRDRSDLASTLAFVLVPAWAFVLLKAVPQTVTEIDPEARVLHVRRFHPLLRYPLGATELAGSELRALDLTSYFYKRNGTRYLQLFALTRAGAVLQLAERPCEGEAAACLASGDADVRELARWLGHPEPQVDSSAHPEHLLLRLDRP